MVTYVSADDVPGSNLTSQDEEIFVTKQVGHHRSMEVGKGVLYKSAA